MGENKVQIVIATRDESSGVVRAISGSFDSLTTHVTAVAFAFNQVQSALSTVLSAVKPVLDTALQFDALDTRLQTIKDSAALAADEMGFISDTTDRLKLELVAAANSYSTFIAATKNSNMEGEQSRLIWLGVAEAIAAQRLPAETTERVLWQLTQMVSKGKVTLEDLNIVAEALPGTLDAVANSMGITKAELLEMINRGDALASDILPKLGEYFHKTFGEQAEAAASKGQGAINNFSNAVTLAKKELGEMVLPSVSEGLNLVADNFGAITIAVQVLAASGAAVVIGRIGSAAIGAAAGQVELRLAVLAGNAVMLDSLSVAKAKAQTELLVARAIEAEKLAIIDKAQAELRAANVTRDAFAASVQKMYATNALAAAEAELALATNATAAAQARYAEATAAASLSSRAASAGSKVLSGALALVGGEVGLVVMALAGLAYGIYKVLNTEEDIKKEAAEARKAREEAEKAERQAVADSKARQDRLVAILGEGTDKQIHELQRRTEEKLQQFGDDKKAEEAYLLAELDKVGAAEGAKREELLQRFWALDKKYADAREKLLRESAQKEAEIRTSPVKEELENRITQLKSAEEYYSALGDLRDRDRAALDREYAEKEQKVNGYFDAEIAKATQAGAEVAGIEEAKQQALLQLTSQYIAQRALLVESENKRALELEESEGNERISLIRQQIAERIRTEVDGQEEIAAIQEQLAGKAYDLAVREFERVASVYGRDSKEYIEAQQAKEQAFERFTNTEEELSRAFYEAEQERLEKSSLDFELELQKRLDWLRDSERDGLITHQQAVRDKLEAEKNYLAQQAELRGRALANEVPDTVAYKQALAEKYRADREYYEAKKALDDQINAEIIARHQQQAAEIEADSARSQVSFRSFAEWFYTQWDVITERVTSLGPKMAAAFGSPLELSENSVEGLRAKMEEVAEATRKAGEMARDYFQFSRLLGEHAKDAEQLRYEYYSQQLTLAELTEQLKKMSYATDEQIRRSTSLVDSLDLIDDSDLSHIRSEIDRLTDAMRQAEEQARDTVDSLRDELDQMLGNKEAIENRNYEERRADLEQKLKDAQAAGNLAIVQEYQEALQLLEEIHQRKLDAIRDEAEAARKADEERHNEELKRIEEESKAREKALKTGSAFTGPTIVSRARGGKIPGFDSPVDNVWVHARTGEWYVRNEAGRFWGDPFMYGVNDPNSEMGRLIQERMSGIVHSVTAPVFAPKISFADGGKVLASERPGKSGHTFNIYTSAPVDERLIRRKVIPEIERYERRKE